MSSMRKRNDEKKANREEANRRRNRKRGKRIAALFFLLAFWAVSFLAIRYCQEDRKQEGRFEELEEIEGEWVSNPIPRISPKELLNLDWIGWVKIEDTHFSYPVMQRKGDGEYYLHRDFDGNDSFYGTPFLDSRCTLDSDNCIIYGHNINGGRMFGKLHAYASEDYYRKHPKVKLRAGEERREYQVVSVIHTTIASPVYSFVETGNWEEYGKYVKIILCNSLYQTELGERIKKEQQEETADILFKKYQFLTLSTCRSWMGQDARLLVVAARERELAE